MTSAIDATKPADGVAALKSDLRTNLAAAKSEIEALQAQVGSLSPYVFKGMRNRLINGSFLFDSRNATLAVTVNSTTSKFGPDRWYGMALAGGGAFTIQYLATGTTPTGFGQYVRITTTTAKGVLVATDSHCFCQAVEGYNWRDMFYGTASAVSAVLSFWVRASTAGTYAVALQNAAQATNYATTYVVNLSNTWEYKTIVIPGPTIGTWATQNTTCVGVRFDLGSGTNYTGATANTWVSAATKAVVTGSISLINTNAATLDLGGVQLEPGSLVTPYDYRMPPIEQAMVTRYYVTGQFSNGGAGVAGVNEYQHVPVPAVLRATPTITRTSESIVNLSGTTVTPTAWGFIIQGAATATGAFLWGANYAADAEITI